MSEQWTRNGIMEMGLVAMQAGVATPDELVDVIRRGMVADYRVPLALTEIAAARGALDNAERMLKGVVE